MSERHPDYMGVYCPTCKQDCLPHRGRCMWCETIVVFKTLTYKNANSAGVAAFNFRKRGQWAKSHGNLVYLRAEAA